MIVETTLLLLVATTPDRACADLARFLEPSVVAAQARIVPSFRSGVAVGFKLFSIRPGSLFALAGLENGDIITRLNRVDITTPDRALEMYGALRDKGEIEVEVIRRHHTLHLAISVPKANDPPCGPRHRALLDLWRRRAEIAGASPATLADALRPPPGGDAAALDRLLGSAPSALDPWGEAYAWFPPRKAPGPGCLVSLGPDHQLGTADDLRFACDLDLLNAQLVGGAALDCRADRADAWGSDIVLRIEERLIRARSPGPDAELETDDDTVATLRSTHCGRERVQPGPRIMHSRTRGASGEGRSPVAP